MLKHVQVPSNSESFVSCHVVLVLVARLARLVEAEARAAGGRKNASKAASLQTMLRDDGGNGTMDQGLQYARWVADVAALAVFPVQPQALEP
jgi:hypothetical protein